MVYTICYRIRRKMTVVTLTMIVVTRKMTVVTLKMMVVIRKMTVGTLKMIRHSPHPETDNFRESRASRNPRGHTERK